jgi:hypothetical protein
MLKAIALVALSLALEGAFILHAVVAAPPALRAAELARAPAGPPRPAAPEAVASLSGGAAPAAR